MDTNSYNDSLRTLRAVRSPLTSDDLRRLLARAPRHRPLALLLGKLALLIFAGSLSLSAPILKFEVSRASLPVKAFNASDSRVSEPVRNTPSTERTVVASRTRVRSYVPSSSDEPTRRVQIPPELSPIINVALTPVRAPAFVPQDRAQAIAFKTNPVGSFEQDRLVASVQTSLVSTRNVASVEYALFDRILVGLTAGVDSRNRVSSVAQVQFRDTTVVSNGQDYTSTVGQLIPATSKQYFGVGGVSARWILNDLAAPWNASVSVGAEYASSSIAMSAGIGGSLHLVENLWASLSAGWHVSSAPILQAGIEAHW